MIVEVRSYRIKPGKREEFIKLFETRAVPAQRSYGMQVTGPFLDVENPNKFVFLRSFLVKSGATLGFWKGEPRCREHTWPGACPSS